jgi:hypothetical protein
MGGENRGNRQGADACGAPVGGAERPNGQEDVDYSGAEVFEGVLEADVQDGEFEIWSRVMEGTQQRPCVFVCAEVGCTDDEAATVPRAAARGELDFGDSGNGCSSDRDQVQSVAGQPRSRAVPIEELYPEFAFQRRYLGGEDRLAEVQARGGAPEAEVRCHR